MKVFSIQASFLKVVELNIIGTFTESITPAVKSGGEGVKLYLLKKHFSLDYNQGASVIIVQKMVSATVFFLYFLISVLCLDIKVPISYQACLVTIFAILISGILIYYVLPSKYKHRVVGFYAKVKKNLSMFKDKRALFYFLFANNLLVWLGYPLKLYIITTAFGVQLGFFQLAGIIFITYGVSMLPTTPGSIGTYEGTMTMLLTLFKVPLEVALSISLITRFFTFYLVVIGSGTCLLIRKLI